MRPDLSCKTKTMKSQIIIFTALITLATALFSNAANVAGTTVKKEKTENKAIKFHAEQVLDAKSGQATQPPKSNQPAKPRR
jgi:hypothetical protein